MRISRTALYLAIYLCLQVSCKKIDQTLKEDDKQVKVSENTPGITSESFGGNCTLSNETLLQLVLTGGGPIFTPNCGIIFPTYIPPQNIGGMLEFKSIAAYDSFSKAVGMMEDLWNYPNVDYEDTPYEIFHLGEESLNALDSALGFQSLRHRYDLNEFYNHDWADTAVLYLEDDDYSLVFNLNHEVKIGSKYYRYISDNIVATVNNDNLNALNMVRNTAIFANHPDIQFYNEETGSYVSPQGPGEFNTEGCAEFQPATHASVSLRKDHQNGLYDYNVSLWTYINYSLSLPNYPNAYSSVDAEYTIDWGDGSSSVLTGDLILGNSFSHTYFNLSVPAASTIVKNITVSCQIIAQQNPTSGYNNLILACPSLVGKLFNSNTTVTIVSFVYPVCMGGMIKRQFNGNEYTVGGTRYRLECKLKQLPNSVLGNAPQVKGKATFTKRKNNRWKTVQSVGDITLVLRGNIYRYYDCNELVSTLGISKSKNKKRKIKIYHNEFITFGFHTQRDLPNAVSIDFLWKHNNNQITVGNYGERLKP